MFVSFAQDIWEMNWSRVPLDLEADRKEAESRAQVSYQFVDDSHELTLRGPDAAFARRLDQRKKLLADVKQIMDVRLRQFATAFSDQVSFFFLKAVFFFLVIILCINN